MNYLNEKIKIFDLAGDDAHYEFIISQARQNIKDNYKSFLNVRQVINAQQRSPSRSNQPESNCSYGTLEYLTLAKILNKATICKRLLINAFNELRAIYRLTRRRSQHFMMILLALLKRSITRQIFTIGSFMATRGRFSQYFMHMVHLCLFEKSWPSPITRIVNREESLIYHFPLTLSVHLLSKIFSCLPLWIENLIFWLNQLFNLAILFICSARKIKITFQERRQT